MHSRSSTARPPSPVRVVPEPRGAGGGISVLVDARGLLISGIGRYLREILQVLFHDPRISLVRLLGRPGEMRDFCEATPGGEKGVVHPYPYGFYSARAQAAWLRLRTSGAVRADVAFYPHYDVPLVGLPSRSVVTVQDLIHFKVPEVFPFWRRRAAGALLHRAVWGSGRVLVSSESTRRDLVERFPGCGSRIDVIPLGVSPFFSVPDRRGPPAMPLPEIGGDPYLLCVGNRKPHKNLKVAVETLALLRDQIPGVRLVIAGEPFPGWAAVESRARELGVHDQVVEVAGISDSDLRALYAHAEVLLFPSLYEGFGLPVLEAMGCGAPVVASNRSSVPEVVGDAGILVDPEDPRAMADAVLRLRREPGLRSEMVRRGRVQAARFPWDRTARDTVDVLCRVAGVARS